MAARQRSQLCSNRRVYRVLERPATPIRHRASLTLVEKHTWRSLERYCIAGCISLAVSTRLARVLRNTWGKNCRSF